MREVFKIALFQNDGSIYVIDGEYNSYTDAVDALKEVETGTYQIQKVFVVS